ncbi:MAG: putative CRISPR-associated protein [Synechococcaceae cyanobacterium SM2_3_1]|nr:putative CRISPR-associated protein [Synechococcaceae cyanobacterium SM2_3_1]
MSHLILTTVGTSLLTNRDERPWSGWQRNQPLPRPEEVDSWLLSADPCKASAEINTLKRLDLNQEDWLELLYSDTPEGKYCSERLSAYFSPQCRSTGQHVIKALDYRHSTFAQNGLKSLIDVVFTLLKVDRPGSPDPRFAATGGFKAEIAFLNLLGALLHIEVYYIHEQFRELVRLPNLPLTWDPAPVTIHQDFFEWIDEEPRLSLEVEKWLQGRPELRPLVEDDGTGYSFLNAAGNLLYKAALEQYQNRPRALWPKADPKPPKDKNGVSVVGHHRPKEWDHFVDRLCSIDCVTYVAYDPSGLSGATVKPLRDEPGAIGIRYGSSDVFLPLRINTTASTEAETELVADYIRHKILKH